MEEITQTEEQSAGGNAEPQQQEQQAQTLQDVSEKSVFSDNADNETVSWTDSLPDELKGNAHLKSFKSANDVIKSYVGLCSMAGKKGLSAPPEGAPQAEVEAYLNTRRGGIVSPESYSLKYEAVQPYGLTEEAYKSVCKDLFDAGLSDREHIGVMRSFAKLREIERSAWVQENNAACERALMEAKHHWGMDYEAKLSGVKQLMKAFPEAKKAFEAMGVQNNFHVLDMLSRFAASASEGGSPKSDGVPVDAKTIDSEINKLVSSKAYSDPSSPAHASAMKQFWELMDKKAKAIEA